MKKMTPKERKDITWDKNREEPWMIDGNPYVDLIYCENLITQILDETSIRKLNNDIIINMGHVVEVLNYRTKELPTAAKIETIPLYHDLKMDLVNARDLIMVARKEMNKNWRNKNIGIIMQNACTIINHHIMVWDDLKKPSRKRRNRPFRRRKPARQLN